MIDTIWGKVRHGDKRGRTIGYPTANLDLHRDISTGVYIARTRVNGTWYPSMAFIGVAKTFGNKVKRAESHLLDYSGDLYGQWISIQLLKRIRGNKRFESVDELVAAIHNDEQLTREFFD